MDERWQTGALRGRYRLAERLGAGGMGEVWAADDEKLGRRVALKRLLGELAHLPEAVARFEREARSLAAVSSDHIASLHGVERTAEGEPFLVMEYVEGPSLRDVLAQGALPTDEALRLFAQLTFALAAAHRAGVVHRDLKPSNIIVRSDGLLVVIDFGVARQSEEQSVELTRSGTIIGSAAYMSPQQAAGLRVGPEADVWSAGVTLYEMLTGELPFNGNNAAEMAAAVLRDTPRPLRELRPDVPRALVSVLDRCLRKPPHERPRDGAELLDLLPAIPLPVAGTGKALWGPELIARGAAHPPLEPTHRWLALVAALSTLVLANVAGLWTWPSSETWLQPSEAEERVEALIGAEVAAEMPHMVSARFFANGNAGAGVRRGRRSFHRLRGVPNPGYPEMGPGELRIAFTDDGRLRWYEWYADDGPMVDVRREAVLKAAGIEGPLRLSPTGERVRGNVLLEGSGVHEGGEATFKLAEHDRRVVFFERTDAPPLESTLEAARPHRGRIGGLVAVILTLALAWYQRWRGRGDARGALVSGAIAGGLTMLAVAATPRVWLDGGWKDHAAGASLVALFCAAAYFGAEPIVRQRWPGALAGWERLVHWRTGSHVLGRELLLGAAASLPVVIVAAVQTRMWETMVPLQEVAAWALSGAGEMVYVLVGATALMLYLAFSTILLGALSLSVLRHPRLAEVVTAVPFAWAITNNLLRPNLVAAGVAWLCIVALLRWGGLMALFAFYGFLNLAWFTPPLSFGGWTWPYTLGCLSVGVGAAFIALRMASQVPRVVTTGPRSAAVAEPAPAEELETEAAIDDPRGAEDSERGASTTVVRPRRDASPTMKETTPVLGHKDRA